MTEAMTELTDEQRREAKAVHGFTADGVPIAQMQAKITNTGDGLSKAMDVEPVIVEAHGVTYIAIRARKIGDVYRYESDDDGDVIATRVQSFSALGSAFVDGSKVGGALERTAGKISAAEAMRLAGQGSFDIDDPDGALDAPDGAKLNEQALSREGVGDLADRVDEAVGA